MASKRSGGGGSFVINPEGVAELLRSDPGIHELIASGTAEVGELAREDFPEGFTVLDGVLITDRPQGNVTVANRSAEAIEGKYGYLSRAATIAGFELGKYQVYTTKSGKTRRATAKQIAHWTKGRRK